MGIPKDLKLVIFDLDGTLINLPIDWVEFKKIIELTPNQTVGSRVEELIRTKNNELLSKATACELKALSEVVIPKGLAETLTELMSKYKVAILTRNSKHVAEKLLDMLGLRIDRVYIIGREDVSFLKPHPEGLKKILKHFQVSFDSVILVGDTHHDIDLANQNKIISILVGDKLDNAKITASYKTDNLASVVKVIHNIDRSK